MQVHLEAAEAAVAAEAPMAEGATSLGVRGEGTTAVEIAEGLVAVWWVVDCMVLATAAD